MKRVKCKMFASIQSERYHKFSCQIKEEPILTLENILVYELVDSSIPNDINITLGDRSVGTFRHIALDTNGVGYLYDFQNKKVVINLGPCSII